ncbi:MAG: hypothetical protein KatS3mg126_1425 [Lysobacteraceae bacterium]|nr:MAG: hypothetical protein KatS3mg126_1425 [Xanthomonadaceae bacterium]
MNLRTKLIFGGLIAVTAVSISWMLVNRSSDRLEASESTHQPHQQSANEGGVAEVVAETKLNGLTGISGLKVASGETGLAQAFAARRHSSMLQSLAKLDAEYALDSYDMVSYANHLCGVMSGGHQPASETYLDLYRLGVSKGLIEENSETEASYRYVDSAREAFCDLGVPSESPQDAAAMSEQRRSEGARSRDFARLLELEKEFMVDGSDGPVEGMAKILASTSSPSVFKEAADMLVETGWIPPGYKVPGFAHREQQQMIAGLGNFLAYCALIPNGCGAGSLLTLRACMPSHCRPGESLQQFFARNFTPDEFSAAQSYANALLAMRWRR